MSFQSKRLRRPVEPRRGAGRRNLGTHITVNPKTDSPTNQARSRTQQSIAPPNPPKTSLHGNRRPKNAENPHKPIRRLPCREVRGDEGGLEGERRFCNAKSAGSGFAALDTPPKGGPSPSKVFLTPPRSFSKSSPPTPLPQRCGERGKRTRAGACGSPRDRPQHGSEAPR